MTGMIPIHPGTVLKENILLPRKISQIKLAEVIEVPLPIIREICQGKRSIDAFVALRLAVYFRTSFKFWLNLQRNYDLRVCLIQENKIKREIKPLITPKKGKYQDWKTYHQLIKTIY